MDQQTSDKQEALDASARAMLDALVGLYDNYRPRLQTVFRWESERDRFAELVFGILLETTGLRRSQCRRVTQALLELDLLDVGGLSDVTTAEGQTNETSLVGPTIGTILQRQGVNREASDRAVSALAEFSRRLRDHYDRPQLFFRRAGESMLKELTEAINVTALDDAAKGRVLTLWLQTALELPLSLTWADPSVDMFCRQFGGTHQQLIAAADAADINVAIVDDLVDLWAADREETRDQLATADTKGGAT